MAYVIDPNNPMQGFRLPTYADKGPSNVGVPSFKVGEGFSDTLAPTQEYANTFAPADGGTDWMSPKFWLGGTNSDGTRSLGAGGFALGALQGIGNAYMGMKQYGLAKDTFEENKRQFALNYEANKKMTNSRLEDQQRARVASNAGAYQSVGDYMKKYGV